MVGYLKQLKSFKINKKERKNGILSLNTWLTLSCRWVNTHIWKKENKKEFVFDISALRVSSKFSCSKRAVFADGNVILFSCFLSALKEHMQPIAISS